VQKCVFFGSVCEFITPYVLLIVTATILAGRRCWFFRHVFNRNALRTFVSDWPSDVRGEDFSKVYI